MPFIEFLTKVSKAFGYQALHQLIFWVAGMLPYWVSESGSVRMGF
jgi:hypothetical protein